MGLAFLFRATVSCPPVCIISIWNDSGSPGQRSAGGTSRHLEFHVCSPGDEDSEVDTVGQGNRCFNIAEAGTNCYKIQYVMLYHSFSQHIWYGLLLNRAPYCGLFFPICGQRYLICPQVSIRQRVKSLAGPVNHLITLKDDKHVYLVSIYDQIILCKYCYL